MKYRLSPELYEEYSKVRGRANRKAAEELFKSKQFRSLSKENKVIALRNAYAQVGDDARIQFLQKNERRIMRGEKQ